MTEEELAAIRNWNDQYFDYHTGGPGPKQHIAALLAEVDRLQAITGNVRRCHACHKEVIVERATIFGGESQE
jgi:hypothetical protein